MSSAFLLSTLGAAGTIIGAALGSVILTVGGALYSQGLARSHQRLAHVQIAAMRKVGVAQAEVRRAARHPGDGEAVDAHLAHAEERLDDVNDDLGALADEPTGPGWRARLVTLPWKRISLIAAVLFAAAVLAITALSSPPARASRRSPAGPRETAAPASAASAAVPTGTPKTRRPDGGVDSVRGTFERALGPALTNGRAHR